MVNMGWPMKSPWSLLSYIGPQKMSQGINEFKNYNLVQSLKWPAIYWILPFVKLLLILAQKCLGDTKNHNGAGKHLTKMVDSMHITWGHDLFIMLKMKFQKVNFMNFMLVEKNSPCYIMLNVPFKIIFLGKKIHGALWNGVLEGSM